MTAISGLRAAIKTSLAGLDDTLGTPAVFSFPAPSPSLPAAVIADDDPLISHRDHEDSGYTVRVVSLRILLMVAPLHEEKGYVQLETWADQMDALLAAVVPPAGFTTPVVTSVSARGLVAYAETTALGQFFDIEVADQYC